MRVTPGDEADARPRSGSARGPYSLSALQKFATCPYQFLLSAIYRLEPNDDTEPLQRLDPLTRGSLFHEVQARVLPRAAGATDGCRSTPARCARRRCRRVDRQLADVAAAYRGAAGAGHRSRVARRDRRARPRPARLGPASCRTPATWSRRTSSSASASRDEGRDPAQRQPNRSRSTAASCLRGSVDLIEASDGLGASCASPTTRPARNRTTPRTVIGGGGDAAARALRHWRSSRSCAQPVRRGPAVLLHGGRRLRRARDSAERRRTAAPGSKRSRSSTARSSSASCPPRPPSGPARGATSARSAAPTKPRHVARKARRAARRPRRRCGRCHDDDRRMRVPMADAQAREAIATALDTRSIVEAAAGTGKTTELVGRIVRILADGQRRGRRDRRGHLHREGGRRAEAAAARSARQRAHGAGDGRRARARLDEALHAARGSARQHHPRLLRRPAARAAGRGRVDPLFEVLTEPASARLFDEAFGTLAAGQLAGSAGRRAPRAAAHRRFGGDDGADRSAAQARRGTWRSGATSPRRGRATPFDRRAARSTRWSRELHDVRRR